jgi:c(7)-type cytochrome triheme protein
MPNGRRIGTALGIGVLALLVWGMGFAQPPKMGGGEILYKPQGADPVIFRHETHVIQYKLKCTDCHTKIFEMKREDLKMTREAHGRDRHCGICHNGKREFNGRKIFSQSTEADCAKCHRRP